MAADTLTSLVGKVRQRVGMLPDFFLIQDWVNSAMQSIATQCEWTWRRRSSQFLFYTSYATGTAAIDRGSTRVTFSGGAVITAAMAGLQLRIGGNNYPFGTISGFVDSTHCDIDQPWGSSSLSGVPYEIYQAYVTVPEDFVQFVAVVDPYRSFQLDYWSYSQSDLDATDPQRAAGSDVSYALVLRDYTNAALGRVSSVVQARGSGNRPVSGGAYTGLVDAIYTIEMTSASVFRWKKDNGALTSGVTIDPDGVPQVLGEGVEIGFPSTVVYTSGDIFTFRASASQSSGLPRYEAWPHKKIEQSIPFLYLAKPPDLTDPGSVLPRYISREILVEMCLAQCARWKHPDNKYYDLRLAQMHDARAADLLDDMMREDQGREATDVQYDSWSRWPALAGNYLVNHDFGPD